MDQVEVKNEQKKERGVKSFLKSAKFRLTALVMACMSCMSMAAFAEGESGSFDAVLSSMDTFGSLMTKVWNLMTANALLTLFLAVSLLAVGVRVFRMIKGAARR